MRSITAEGFQFIYLARGEDVSGVKALGIDVPQVDPLMFERVSSVQSVRPILVPHRPGSRLVDVNFLHWNDGTDLDEVDRKVEACDYTDKDFESSIMCTHQNTWCRNCNRRWNTLIVPPDSYIGAGDLYQRKIAMREKAFKRCPACNASLRQLVVEFL